MTRPAREPARAGGFGSRRTSQYEPRPSDDATLDRLLRRAAASRRPDDPLRFDAPPGDDAMDVDDERPTLFVWRDGADPRPVPGAPPAPVVEVSTNGRYTILLFADGSVQSLAGFPYFARERGPKDLALKREAKVEDVRPTAVVVAMAIGRIVASAPDGVYQGLLEDIRKGGFRGFEGGQWCCGCCALDAEGRTVVLVDAAGRAHATVIGKVWDGKDVVEGATAFRACACGGGYGFFLAVGGSIFEYSWRDGGRTRRLPWPHAPPVEIACDHEDRRLGEPTVAVARCCDGSVVAWVAGGDAYEVMSGDLAAKGVRCRSARVFGGVVVATSEAGNVYRARAGAPLELLRVFADAGLCVEDAWPLTGGEILVAVASRPPAPVEAAPAAAPPYAAPPPWAPRPRPAPAAPIDAPDASRCGVSGPLWDACSSTDEAPPAGSSRSGTPAEALPAGWHEAYVALRDARGRSVARGGWDVACASTSPTEVIDRGDGVYVVRALAAPPEVALTVTVGGRAVGAARFGAARWRASVVADERPIKIYVKSDGRRMESHAQAYGVKRYGDTVRALKDQVAAKTRVAPGPCRRTA